MFFHFNVKEFLKLKKKKSYQRANRQSKLNTFGVYIKECETLGLITIKEMNYWHGLTSLFL